MSIYKNCGKPQDEHYALNYADGPMVSGTVLVCPNSIYQLARDTPRKKQETERGR